MSTAVLNSTITELLSRCTGADPETRCQCEGSYLAYVAGQWRHIAICSSCLGKTSCPDPVNHTACTAPTPISCTHPHCTEPVGLETTCAEPGNTDCCGHCCWNGVPACMSQR